MEKQWTRANNGQWHMLTQDNFYKNEPLKSERKSQKKFAFFLQPFVTLLALSSSYRFTDEAIFNPLFLWYL